MLSKYWQKYHKGSSFKSYVIYYVKHHTTTYHARPMSFLFIEHWKVSCELKVVDILEEKKDIIEHKIHIQTGLRWLTVTIFLK